MSTRRFTDNLEDPQATSAAPRGAQTPAQPPSPSRGGAHLPRTLTQVLNEANDRVVRGDLADYVPLPTGFDPLDGFIGGGLRKTELVLLGGSQGIGKPSQRFRSRETLPCALISTSFTCRMNIPRHICSTASCAWRASARPKST
jgi:hypothetical protein